MKKIIISVLFLSSILSCSGTEEGNNLKEEKGISTPLSGRKFIVTPLVDPKIVTTTSTVSLSAKNRADRCISREYDIGRSMFHSEMFDKQQRLTPEALDALKDKSKAILQIRSNTPPEPCARSAPLDIIPDEEPE